MVEAQTASFIFADREMLAMHACAVGAIGVMTSDQMFLRALELTHKWG